MLDLKEAKDYLDRLKCFQELALFSYENDLYNNGESYYAAWLDWMALTEAIKTCKEVWLNETSE